MQVRRFKCRATSRWPEVTQQALDQQGVGSALTLYPLPSLLQGSPRGGAGSLMQLVPWPAGTYLHFILPPSSPMEDGATRSGFLGSQPGSLAASEAPWDGKSGRHPDINNHRWTPGLPVPHCLLRIPPGTEGQTVTMLEETFSFRLQKALLCLGGLGPFSALDPTRYRYFSSF